MIQESSKSSAIFLERSSFQNILKKKIWFLWNVWLTVLLVIVSVDAWMITAVGIVSSASSFALFYLIFNLMFPLLCNTKRIWKLTASSIPNRQNILLEIHQGVRNWKWYSFAQLVLACCCFPGNVLKLWNLQT